MPSALILIADGTEEMEFTITYDTLVRAGVKCTSAFVEPQGRKSENTYATCSRGVRIVPDMPEADIPLDAADVFDAIVVPGGAKGAETISQKPTIQALVRDFYGKKKVVSMICAGSIAALESGLPFQPLTSHPSVKEQLDRKYDYREDPVIVSSNLITSRGPGTAFPFALTIVEMLCGPEKRKEVYEPMVFPK
ncbi:DJ-1 [Vararia minispora EC-137]|uniref:DJ-1 n=1 Tax=Vararia minispora EC-137 TaxID=1314806 RepID=A0ACB8QLS6_9AGAM|nr:DJ-1 [Vararia minispora EC-137]